jgi:23S rRNA (pseudouridine1915-N3)-methyltransferase
MKITLLLTGKTEADWLKEGINLYLSRLKHYIAFNLVELPGLKGAKNLSEEQQKLAEAEMILKQVGNSDHVVLLDENGAGFSSLAFSKFLEKKMTGNTQRLIFIVGGPYGFHQQLYNRANEKLALSPMTFSHQMVRVLFMEQLYRAFTIIKGEKYHHA